MTDGWFVTVLLAVIIGSFLFGQWSVRRIRATEHSDDVGRSK